MDEEAVTAIRIRDEKTSTKLQAMTGQKEIVMDVRKGLLRLMQFR